MDKPQQRELQAETWKGCKKPPQSLDLGPTEDKGGEWGEKMQKGWL